MSSRESFVQGSKLLLVPRPNLEAIGLKSWSEQVVLFTKLFFCKSNSGWDLEPKKAVSLCLLFDQVEYEVDGLFHLYECLVILDGKFLFKGPCEEHLLIRHNNRDDEALKTFTVNENLSDHLAFSEDGLEPVWANVLAVRQFKDLFDSVQDSK